MPWKTTLPAGIRRLEQAEVIINRVGTLPLLLDQQSPHRHCSAVAFEVGDLPDGPGGRAADLHREATALDLGAEEDSAGAFDQAWPRIAACGEHGGRGDVGEAFIGVDVALERSENSDRIFVRYANVKLGQLDTSAKSRLLPAFSDKGWERKPVAIIVT